MITVCLGHHTAAAKWLQSCPTLCDPIDGSPPGFPVPGILQARTLEWVAISFSEFTIQLTHFFLVMRTSRFILSETLKYTICYYYLFSSCCTLHLHGLFHNWNFVPSEHLQPFCPSSTPQPPPFLWQPLVLSSVSVSPGCFSLLGFLFFLHSTYKRSYGNCLSLYDQFYLAWCLQSPSYCHKWQNFPF